MPNSNLRRMMMAQKHSAPSEDWDIDWKYTDGPLTDSGFSINGTPEMKSDGLYLKAFTGIYYPSALENAKKSVVEVKVIPKNFYPARQEGFRVILSDGAKGCHLHMTGSGFIYDYGDSHTFLADAYLRTLYLIRMEFDSKAGNKIYINGQLIVDTPEFSTFYAAGNRIFQQGGYSETVIKEIRYKTIER